MLESTFIIKPIMPVELIVSISKKETITEIATLAHGPSAKPAMTIATSFGSKERKPAKRTGIRFPKLVRAYAKAQKTPVETIHLILSFAFIKILSKGG